MPVIQSVKTEKIILSIFTINFYHLLNIDLLEEMSRPSYAGNHMKGKSFRKHVGHRENQAMWTDNHGQLRFGYRKFHLHSRWVQ